MTPYASHDCMFSCTCSVFCDFSFTQLSRFADAFLLRLENFQSQGILLFLSGLISCKIYYDHKTAYFIDCDLSDSSELFLFGVVKFIVPQAAPNLFSDINL